jgi:oligoendopeptidase F
MWVDGVDRALNKRIVQFKDEKVPINEAIPKMGMLVEKGDRDKLWEGISAELKTIHDFCESELNAFYTNKKITDELRKYKHPYSSTMLSHEMDEKVVFGLRDAVNARVDISHRFFALKKRMLKLTEMRMHDCGAPLTTGQKKMTFQESHDTVRAAFAAFDPDYLRIFERAFAKGHVDVYPKQGKGGGAFHSKTLNNPGVILLNQVDDIRSAFTIAHEMGHLVHSSLAEEAQASLYRDYSTATAEVASRFAERVYFEHILPTLTKEEQIALRMKVAYEDMNNIFHAISDFNIEHRFYQEVYKRGFVPFDEMCAMFVEENKKCFGQAITMKPDDGYRVIYISHFRLRYYLYSYAFGSLVARALYAKVKADKTFVTSVKAFMQAGSSKRPADIFKSVGVDVTKKDFFNVGLDAIEADIAALEKLLT